MRRVVRDSTKAKVDALIAFLSAWKDEPDKVRRLIPNADEKIGDMFRVYRGAKVHGDTKEHDLDRVREDVCIVLEDWWEDDSPPYLKATEANQRKRREWFKREAANHIDPAFRRLSDRFMRDTFAAYKPKKGDGGQGLSATAAELITECGALGERVMKTDGSREEAVTRVRGNIEKAHKKIKTKNERS